MTVGEESPEETAEEESLQAFGADEEHGHGQQQGNVFLSAIAQ